MMSDRKDSLHEGRDEYFMDVDRMMNEGLAGGNVDKYKRQIGDCHEFEAEDPPQITAKQD
jgi:hypothetical protein